MTDAAKAGKNNNTTTDAPHPFAKPIGAIRKKFARPKLRDTDYLYATAYIRAVEDRGLSRATVKKMLDAPDAKSAAEALFEARGALGDANADAGVGSGAPVTEPEALVDAFVNDSFRMTDEITHDPHVFDFLRYQYDCNNIKTALKCAARGVDAAADGLYFECGTIPTSVYAKMTAEHDYSMLPPVFADAARAAADAYAKTGDPQSIDLPLDRACFEAMLANAEESGERLLRDAVVMRIDMSNVLTAIRVIRMGMGPAELRGLLERALSPFGAIPTETIIKSSEDGEEALLEAVSGMLPVSLAEMLVSGTSLSAAERMTDDAYLSYVRDARSIVFGVSVPFVFLVEREYNAKNARIILACKRARLDYDDIASRIRTV